MTYLNKPTLSQQQHGLQTLIDERLNSEESRVRQRVYKWLNNNQYFVDNELFDFYFCVAQNIAAVEVLGGSGEKIVKAKIDLEEAVEAYTTQIVDTSNWINEQLKGQLHSIQTNQQKLDINLMQTLEVLNKEHQNLKTISNGLINSSSVLLNKQKQLVIQTEAARRYAYQAVIIAWIIPIISILGFSLIYFLLQKN